MLQGLYEQDLFESPSSKSFKGGWGGGGGGAPPPLLSS